jgi:hypothetical protein
LYFSKKLPYPGREARTVAEVLLELVLEGRLEAGCGQALAGTVLGERDDRRGARLEPRVLAEAHERLGPPFGSDLVVEQGADAREERLGQVEIRDVVFLAQAGPRDVALSGVDHELEVQPHVRVLLGVEQLLQGGHGVLGRLDGPVGELRLQVQDLLVESGHAQAPRGLGGEASEDPEQDLGALVRPLHLRLLVSEKRQGGSQHEHGNTSRAARRESHQKSSRKPLQ